jgi:putative addiction module component (TIGR02574 family)
MPATFASLGLSGLTDGEKLELVGHLWDELVASSPPGGLLTDAQRQELRRREADAVAKPDDWIAWNDATLHG